MVDLSFDTIVLCSCQTETLQKDTSTTIALHSPLISYLWNLLTSIVSLQHPVRALCCASDTTQRSCSHGRAAAWVALFSPQRAGYVKQQPDPQGSDGSLRHAWASVRGSVRGSSKAGYGSLANSTSTLMPELSGGTANSGSTEMVRLMPGRNPPARP